MLLFKRNMLKFGDFEYEIISSDGCVCKIIRQRDGTRFHYFSRGFVNDFDLVVNRKYVSTNSIDGDSRRIGGCYDTSIGYQGNIMYCVKKGSFFLKNIFYWSIYYNNKYYKIYEVGIKNEGIFYCVYLENVLVSMIKKSPKVFYNSTQYEIYSEKHIPVELLSILTLFVDLTRHYPDPQKSQTVSTQCRITLQKELKEKYDPTFISRIKAQDGVSE